jgi:hypothetical protein
LQIHHETIESTQGERDQHLREPHFNIQRRWYDYQCSLTTTPAAFEQAHHAFMTTDTTTAHQGLLTDRFDTPIPLVVLGEVTGRLYTAEALNRHVAHELFPRTTNRHGCVTLHHDHCYGEQGLPTTPVLLWLSGDQLRAVFKNVVVAASHCHDDWRRRPRHPYPRRRVVPHPLCLLTRRADPAHSPRVPGALSPAVWEASPASGLPSSAMTAL